MQARPRARRREIFALGVAAFSHLAIVIAAHSLRVPSAVVDVEGSPQPVAELAMQEITVLDRVEAPERAAARARYPSSSPSSDAPLGANELGTRLTPSADSRAAAGAAVLTAPEVASAAPMPPSEADGAWSFASTQVDTGLGAARFGGAAAANDAVARSARSDDVGGPTKASAAANGLAATNALLDGLNAHDIANGTSRGGPLLAAVEEAAHMPDAPSLGVAVFDITVSRSGAPQVSLVSAKDSPEAWTKLGTRIAGLTAQRQATVRLPDNGQGIRVRIRVEAVDRLADGADIASRGKTTGTLHKGTLVRTGRVEDLPHAEFAHEGRICSVTAGVNPISPYLTGGCSPENVLPAVRMVAARILSETRL